LTVNNFLKKDFNLNPASKAKDEQSKLIKNIGKEILQSFGTTDFWAARYSKITPNNPTYDWYMEFSDVFQLLLNHVPPIQQMMSKKIPSDEKKKLTSPRVLHIGCGNSNLSERLYDEGISNIIGIDFCKDIIDVMCSRRDHSHMDSLIYEHMDARGLRFPNDCFDVIIDKGCMDCMVCVPKGQDEKESLHCCIREVARVLLIGGIYILISCGISVEDFRSFFLENLGLSIIHSERREGKEGLNLDFNVIISRREK